MNPVFHHSHDGFVALDLDTGITCYAYPTSTYWTAAKKKPASVAREMLGNERRTRGWCSVEIVARYDARNRAQLMKAEVHLT